MNRWDEIKHERIFWDPEVNRGRGGEFTQSMSDLDLIKNPALAQERGVFNALFNIIIELTEKVNDLEAKLNAGSPSETD
jgi:hypothetical protein